MHYAPPTRPCYSCPLMKTLLLSLALAAAAHAQDDKPDVARAHAEQIATGLKLYAEFCGGYPEKLDALVKKPDGVKLWPEGGFLLVPEIPKDPWGRDYVYDGKTLACGDVVEKLPKIEATSMKDALALTRFVRPELLRATVIAVRRRTKTLPTSVKDVLASPLALVKEASLKGESAGLLLTGAKEGVRVTFAAKVPESAKPTDEEKKKIDALVRDLGADDIETREKATAALAAMGSKFLETLDGYAPDDAEVKARLDSIRLDLRKPIEEALRAGAIHLYAFPSAGLPLGGRIPANERNAATCLRACVTAEENLKGNDVDRNGIGDYWTADLRGLYCIVMTATKRPTACLSDLGMVKADTSPVPEKYEGIDMDGDTSPDTTYDTSVIEGFSEIPVPKNGYLFKALVEDEQGEAYAQDTDGTGSTHNYGQYGFCAYPAEYGATGTMTFIVNNIGSVFMRDTRGRPVESWPDAAVFGASWSKVP